MTPRVRAVENDLAQQAQRHWRLALIGYGGALTIATHWPQLELPGHVPATDKTLHLIAFGALTIVVRGAFRSSSPWLTAIIALAWSILDECSQAIPGINRVVALDDGIANVLGVLTAGIWLQTLRPFNQLQRTAYNALWADWRTWAVAIALACVGAAIITVTWRTGTIQQTRTAIIGVSIGLALIGCPALWWRHRTLMRTHARDADAPITNWRRALPLFAIFVIIGIGLTALVLTSDASTWRPSAKFGVQTTLARSFDVFCIGVLLAFAVEMARRRLFLSSAS